MDPISTASSEPTSAPPPIGQDQKFCMDCGKIILRRAEICPACGCRQTAAPASNMRSDTPWISVPRSGELQSSFVTQMAILLCLNVLWNGLGNLAIGDKRGWAFGFFNWIVAAIAFFTVGIPVLLYFAYCGYAGYQFLLESQNAAVGAIPMQESSNG